MEKDGVCTWSQDTTNRILVFCTYLYVVAEQTLSISVIGTAQLTTGIIKHTIGFFINDLEHLLSIPFKSCYHKLLYLINTGHNSPLDHKSHNGLLLSPAAPKARDGRYFNAPRPSVCLCVCLCVCPSRLVFAL